MAPLLRAPANVASAAFTAASFFLLSSIWLDWSGAHQNKDPPVAQNREKSLVYRDPYQAGQGPEVK